MCKDPRGLGKQLSLCFLFCWCGCILGYKIKYIGWDASSSACIWSLFPPLTGFCFEKCSGISNGWSKCVWSPWLPLIDHYHLSQYIVTDVQPHNFPYLHFLYLLHSLFITLTIISISQHILSHTAYICSSVDASVIIFVSYLVIFLSTFGNNHYITVFFHFVWRTALIHRDMLKCWEAMTK